MIRSLLFLSSVPISQSSLHEKRKLTHHWEQKNTLSTPCLDPTRALTSPPKAMRMFGSLTTHKVSKRYRDMMDRLDVVDR
ncbi:hypothetical protein GcC1_00845 [Golovinomyces cichoracearum]|uniref:Uncharacterized protein n=1 Tax=Golovinomyces cichoracearum TaxID=62708 RepID=A0A420HIZ5_9PEZI|nr:hypothetical protein GcC1_00845 [Golovinomyces cichoracearum]